MYYRTLAAIDQIFTECVLCSLTKKKPEGEHPILK